MSSLGHKDDASFYYEKTIELNPNLIDAQHNKGGVPSSPRLNNDDAVPLCDKIIKLRPYLTRLLTARASILIEVGR